MKALTVRQPWAWLLFNGKPVENRDWYTAYRGPLAIHAAKAMTREEYQAAVLFVRSFDPELAAKIPSPQDLRKGAVIGTVLMVDCVKGHPSPFFCGAYGHLYRDPVLYEVPVYCKGALGLWEFNNGR